MFQKCLIMSVFLNAARRLPYHWDDQKRSKNHFGRYESILRNKLRKLNDCAKLETCKPCAQSATLSLLHLFGVYMAFITWPPNSCRTGRSLHSTSFNPSEHWTNWTSSAFCQPCHPPQLLKDSERSVHESITDKLHEKRDATCTYHVYAQYMSILGLVLAHKLKSHTQKQQCHPALGTFGM